MRALPALVAIALAVAVAIVIAGQEGSVSIAWQGWIIDTSVPVLAGATIIAALLLALVLLVLRAVLRGPRAWRRARRERRRRLGYRALTQGMVAVAAGDAEEAQKLARKADALLAEPPLTLLLSAQAAQLNGEESAATRYFTAMLERPETEFLGLRGLMMQALKGGDEAAALRLAERAKTLRPKTPWLLTQLAELQARGGRWQAAEATLIEAERRKALPPGAARHRKAVVLFEEALEADAAGRASEAMRLFARAHAVEPACAPIAERYARMLAQRGQTRHARRVITQAWRTAPHPLLADAYRTFFPDETASARLKQVERLAALNPEHEESRIALAQAALAARLWGEARRHLEPLAADPEHAPPRVARLMAEIEESEHEDHQAARTWLARAAASNAPDPAWACEECGAESAAWSATCPGCRGFATLAWRTANADRPPPRLSDPAAFAARLLARRS